MIKLNTLDIKKAINESLEEVRALNFGTSPSQSAAASTQGQTPLAKPAAGSKAGILFPSPQYAYFQEENGEYKLIVRIKGIHAQHQDLLVQKWNQEYGSYMKVVIKGAEKTSQNAPAPIDLIINPDNEDDFKVDATKISQDIADLNGKPGKHGGIQGFYDDRSIKELPSKIVATVESAPSKEELDRAESRRVLNIEELLKKINDPEIINKISKITGQVNWQPTALVNGTTPAHRLSVGNQLEVYSQLPNATFVTNAWTWLNKYNRTINNLNEFAIIKKSTNNKPKDLKAWNNAAASNGFRDPNGVLSPYDYFNAIRKDDLKRVQKGMKPRISQAQLFQMLATANMLTPTTTDFISEKVYDVSNTTLIQGMPDVWNETIDFKDNLQGLANDNALNSDIKAAAASANITANAKVTLPQQQVSTKTDDEIIEVIDTVKALCSIDCKTMPNSINGTLGDQLFHFSKFYAEHTINLTANKPEVKEAIFNAFGLCVVRLFGASTSKGDEVQKKFRNNTSANSIDLKGAISETYRDFKRFIVKIQADLYKKSNNMVKAGMKISKTQKGAPASTVAQSSMAANAAQPVVTKQVMQEAISENEIPISLNDFAQVAMSELDKITSENDVTVDDNITQQEIQESFFKFLDKIERIF